MDACLLCLEINKEFGECIKVDSEQWQERNIKLLIEKHLWIMESISASCWLCQTCWQALYDFHNFYLRIEEAHMDFGKLMKKIKPESRTQHTDLTDDENDDKNDLFESHLEPEILVMEDHKTIIKQEPNDDLEEDNLPLPQRRKRRRNSKDITNDNETRKDPLKNSKQSKKSSKSKSKKKDPAVHTNTSKTEMQKLKEDPENIEKKETEQLKQDPDTFENLDISNVSINSSDSDDFDLNTDFHYKSEEEDIKQTKKTRRKQSTSGSDDNKSDEDTNKEPKRSAEERDKFLAENFKMSCALCDIVMPTFKALYKHFQSEHKERGYAVCCKKKFFDRCKLLEHVERHVDPDNFKCNECGKELSSRKTLQIHHLSHLPDEEKKFTCTKCGKNYASTYNLNYHIQAVHQKKFVKICHICGKTIGTSTEYKAHMEKHEGKPAPIISCDICGLLLTTERGLKRHKEAQHPEGGKRYHCCPICPKVSPTVNSLKKHIRRMHDKKGYEHKCTICEKAFKRSESLKEHMAAHTGTALYTCPWCPKTFNSNGNMHSHRKKMHPREWEEAQFEKYSGNLTPQFRNSVATKDGSAI